MSETMTLYKLLMLGLIFNSVMVGIFSFVNDSGLANIENCDVTNILPNESAGGVPNQIVSCEPSGLPYWYYIFWLIIDGVLIYAVIPFIK